MKFYSFLLVSCLCLSFAKAQTATAPPKNYVFLGTKNAVQYKNFYFLTLLQELEGVKKEIQKDVEISGIFKDKQVKISSAVEKCDKNISCYAEAIKFSDTEIERIGNRLSILYKSGNVMGSLVKDHLIASGNYILYNSLPAPDLIKKAWEHDAKAINFTIGVYVEGNKPNYPKIDSISFNVNDKSYPDLVKMNAMLSLNKTALFFEPAMQFALTALDINERNDIADYEPMISTVNKKAIESIKKTNFNTYKYSLILVPGEGPEEEGVKLSAGGMLRCRLAAEQFKLGLAPFIMVSGARVHPYKTKFSEAYEMKVYLINTLHIPEHVIIMEPHARHTTTNMRNASRLMFRYNIPMDKPAVTVTSMSQSDYIAKSVLKRCVKDLGYEPFKNGNRLSSTILEFYPNINALQLDFDEPMDP